MNCSTIEAARKYLNAGISVIPLKTDGSKSPAVSWKEFQSRQAGEIELQDWYQNGKVLGIGLVTGNISGNLHVLDFDYDGTEFCERFLQEAEERLPGIRERLVVVSTPRPGRQVLFRQMTRPPGNTVLAYTEPLDTGEYDDDRQPIHRPVAIVKTGEVVVTSLRLEVPQPSTRTISRTS